MSKTTIELELTDVRSLLQIIRSRQDECRKVTIDCPSYNTYHSLDLRLERLKMMIANQIKD